MRSKGTPPNAGKTSLKDRQQSQGEVETESLLISLSALRSYVRTALKQQCIRSVHVTMWGEINMMAIETELRETNSLTQVEETAKRSKCQDELKLSVPQVVTEWKPRNRPRSWREI